MLTFFRIVSDLHDTVHIGFPSEHKASNIVNVAYGKSCCICPPPSPKRSKINMHTINTG